MPIGSINDRSLDVQAASSSVASGDPVIVGIIKGFAVVDAFEAQDGNYWTTVDTQGSYKVAVAGTLHVGDTVFLASGSVTAGEAVTVTLTNVEGTTGKTVFGTITDLAQESGSAFVLPIQGTAKGATS